jgi:hypothetical protein
MEVKKASLKCYSKDFVGLGKNVVVGVGFKVKCSPCILNKICCPSTCECFPSGGEEACLCYAIYQAVKMILCGNVLRTKNSKVTNVSWSYTDGYFSLSWCMPPSLSGVRKALALALKVVNPGKLFPFYSKIMQHVGHSPKKEQFNHVADEITKSLKNETEIIILGNMKLESKDTGKAALTAALETISKKFEPASDGKKEKPSGHTECKHEHVEIKASGWETYLGYKFLEDKLKRAPQVYGNTLALSLKPQVWETARKKLKGAVADYAVRFPKVADLASFIAFDGLASGLERQYECITIYLRRALQFILEKLISKISLPTRGFNLNMLMFAFRMAARFFFFAVGSRFKFLANGFQCSGKRRFACIFGFKFHITQNNNFCFILQTFGNFIRNMIKLLLLRRMSDMLHNLRIKRE